MDHLLILESRRFMDKKIMTPIKQKVIRDLMEKMKQTSIQ